MKEFQSIKAIFANLNDLEIRELRRKFASISTSTEQNKISLKFLEILANNSDLTLNDAQYKLYNRINLVAFRKLNQRFLDKIVDILTYKEIVELNESYDERAKIIFSLEKKLLLVDLFRFRGLFKISDELLDQVIRTAKEYENYEIVVYSLYKKRLRLPGTDSSGDLVSIDKDVEKYQKYSLVLSYVKKLYTNLILLHNNNDLSRTIVKYRSTINKINSLSNKFESSSLKFYSAMLTAQYYSMLGEDSKASVKLINLLDSIRDTNIFSNNRYGTILLNLALYKRNNREFNEAQFYINEASKYLSRINETKIVVYYQTAALYFIIGDLDKSQYYIKLMSSIVIDKIDIKLKERIYFFYVLNLFVTGKFHELLLHLSSFKSKGDSILENEKKLLLWMTSIELGKYDQADKLYDLLRKCKHERKSSDFKLLTNKNT